MIMNEPGMHYLAVMHYHWDVMNVLAVIFPAPPHFKFPYCPSAIPLTFGRSLYKLNIAVYKLDEI